MKWPVVDPGDMNVAITVLGPSVVAGVSGAEVSYTQTILSGYAAVEEERGDDAKGMDQVSARQRLTLRTWFDDRVKSDMRLQTDHGTWIIEQVVNVRKMDAVMLIYCIALGVDE